VYTDYNEEAAHRAAALLAGALGDGGALRRGPALNPFRQPFLMRPPDNWLPTMSNAWAVVTQAGGRACDTA
jgi:hypothetical protein